MANADEYFNSELKDSGGWLKALDQSLQSHVELHVAFYMQHEYSFKYKNTFYHPIKTNQNILNKIANRFNYYVEDNEHLGKYLEIINMVKPDIIHIHGTENAFAIVIPHTNIPVVVSIQGIITEIFHKYFDGLEKRFLYVTDRKMKSFKDFFFPWSFYVDYRRLKKMQMREERNLKLVKFIMGRTDWDKRVTRLLSPDSTYFRDDRLLRDLFYQRQWTPHFSDSNVIIHTTTGNYFYKGYETLCMAFNELTKRGIRCEWRVAGLDHNDLIVKIVKKKLKNKYPQQGLLLMGRIGINALMESLLESDMYVMTSHIETNANNLCEAMILGMPCISPFVGGIGSLIKDGEDGMLIPDGDPWAMAGAVLEMVSNKDRAIQLGHNARRVSMERHDKDRIINDLLKVYETIMKGGNGTCQ
jgi:glycosyltransferase involved in cell wall biosynthesis